jgi:hypothetical protein
VAQQTLDDCAFCTKWAAGIPGQCPRRFTGGSLLFRQESGATYIKLRCLRVGQVNRGREWHCEEVDPGYFVPGLYRRLHPLRCDSPQENSESRIRRSDLIYSVRIALRTWPIVTALPSCAARNAAFSALLKMPPPVNL